MAKSVKQKIKLLRILEILKADSDEMCPMSTNELISKLNFDGIKCGRKALYDDIALLNEYGYEIGTIKSKQNLYYILDRTFDIAELRILLDAIQSASFITKKKTNNLVDKIAALAGAHRAELLKHNTVYIDTLKHSNENIYYTIDAIESAIFEKKKFSFMYFDLDVSGSRVYRRDSERYVVNPVGLVFSASNYYLVCYNDKRKLLTNYRVDRMDKAEMQIEDITFADCVKDFDSYKNQNIMFNMFSGEVYDIKLLVHNTLSEVIFDKFGSNIKLHKADDMHFTVNIRVQVSPVFFGWCAMFGDKLKIVSPKEVADELVKSILTTLSQYTNGED